MVIVKLHKNNQSTLYGINELSITDRHKRLTEQGILHKYLLETGQARSNPAPPIYPFTIPPEGEQENQGYHGYQGSENNNDAIKVLALATPCIDLTS